ncbi:MAG: hypothetical protein RLZZ568_968 [Cyanobacteriota bacterium]|jgi:hypothetical protein
MFYHLSYFLVDSSLANLATSHWFNASMMQIGLLYLSKINYLQEEQTVAKRRNLKKEKAERNRAYARQFRSASRTQNRRYGGRQQQSGNSSGSSTNGAASDV